MYERPVTMAQPELFSIQNAQGVATIRIIGDIGYWSNSSEQFTRLIDQALEAGATSVEGYINCYGGSVFEANEIGNQIQRFTGAKNVKIGAIAASAGGYLTTYFDKVTASKNTQIMVHDLIMPVSIEHVEDFDSNKQLYVNLRDDVVSRFVAKTGKTTEEILAMMRATTWMNAETAKKMGFVDAIDDQEEKLPENLGEKDIKNLPESLITAIQNSHKRATMSKVNTALGLAENATEEQAVAAINALKTTATDAVKELATNKGFKPEAINQLATDNPSATLVMVKAMVPPTSNEAPNPANTEKPDNATPPVTANNSNDIVKAIENVLTAGGGTGGASNKKLSDYSPTELENLAEKEPAKYAELVENEYKR